jgi:hypothetical protein
MSARRSKRTLFLAIPKPQLTTRPQLPLREPWPSFGRLPQFNLTNLQLGSVTLLAQHHIVRIGAIDDELLRPWEVISPLHLGEFPFPAHDTKYSALMIWIQIE